MKNKLFLAALFLSFNSAFAFTNCSEKLTKVVNQLDIAYVHIVGVAQGDYEETPYVISGLKSVKSAKGLLETYQVVGSHMNDEGGTWNDTYRITLSNPGCYLESYQFLGSKK